MLIHLHVFVAELGLNEQKTKSMFPGTLKLLAVYSWHFALSSTLCHATLIRTAPPYSGAGRQAIWHPPVSGEWLTTCEDQAGRSAETTCLLTVRFRAFHFPSCFDAAFQEVALLLLRSHGWRQIRDLFLLQIFVQSETLVPGKMSTEDTFRSNADNALPDNQQEV